MAKFDFVTDEGLRASLDSDYAELTTSMSSGAWKAVHVLAGSIIEALLADYLVSESYQKGKKGPLELDLAEIIEASKERGAISERAAQLSTVVRGYRNLIHPGRLIRLQEKVGESSAKVAEALVEMIVGEVAEKRISTYGLTAEQLLSKLEQDSSAIPILNHLLRDMKPNELERFLVKVLPARYFELINAPLMGQDILIFSSLQACFRPAFDFAPVDIKKRVSRNFVTIVREETLTNVLGYEDAFFRGGDLAYLEPEDVQLVKKHLLSRFANDRSANYLTFQVVFDGIGEYLSPNEAKEFARVVYLTLLREDLDRINSSRMRNALFDEYAIMPLDADKAFVEALTRLQSFAQDRGYEQIAQLLGEILEHLLSPLE